MKSHEPVLRYNTELCILNDSTKAYILKCSLQLQGELLNKV